ncbi:MAG: hypothetical protein EHM18_08975 [Acidobacteria bacterium]|nr:MAG: hypothetical protein EHM18_08975 [Acidobacteriota bacterium]
MSSRRPAFIRNYDAWGHLEVFLVAAVAAVLSIRLFLELTGYPQLGGEGLHIAHMLWGGLLMAAAMIMLLSFIGRTIHRWASLIGGLGFGVFIDEIGKFVTSNNDYFFEPAVSLIYVVFVLTFMAAHIIHSRPRYSPAEYLMNALHRMEEVVFQDLDSAERGQTLALLEKCNRANPLVACLTDLLDRTDLVGAGSPGFLGRLRRMWRYLYRRLARMPQFPKMVIWLFVVQLALKLLYVGIVVFLVGYGRNKVPLNGLMAWFIGRIEDLTFVDYAQLLSSVLSGVFVLIGVLRIRRSRTAAFLMFEQSILVSIFLTEVFSFYEQQFLALIGLGLNILLLTITRYALRQEASSVSTVVT